MIRIVIEPWKVTGSNTRLIFYEPIINQMLNDILAAAIEPENRAVISDDNRLVHHPFFVTIITQIRDLEIRHLYSIPGPSLFNTRESA